MTPPKDSLTHEPTPTPWTVEYQTRVAKELRQTTRLLDAARELLVERTNAHAALLAERDAAVGFIRQLAKGRTNGQKERGETAQSLASDFMNMREASDMAASVVQQAAKEKQENDFIRAENYRLKQERDRADKREEQLVQQIDRLKAERAELMAALRYARALLARLGTS